MLTSVNKLFTQLHDQSINYVHWKSNLHLSAALAGDEDLDLLIDSNDYNRFIALLHTLNFRIVETHEKHPFVEHAIAFDEETGQLIHVHFYRKIISGDSLVKNYALPFEKIILNNISKHLNVCVPEKKVELSILLIRIALKHANFIERKLLYRNYEETIREIRWLSHDVSTADIISTINAVIPDITPKTVQTALDAFSNGTKPNRFKAKIAKSIRRTLSNYRRLSFLRYYLKLLRIVIALTYRRMFKKTKFQIGSDGLLIAFIGPKAVGKSTLIAKIHTTLGRYLPFRYAHIGKPPMTILTCIPHILLPILRSLLPSRRTTEYEKIGISKISNPTYLYILRTIMLAYERSAYIQKLRKLSSRGILFLCDRYPSKNPGALDSSYFDNDVISRCSSSLKKHLMRLEQKIYMRIPDPDLCIRLKADIDTITNRDSTRNKKGAVADPEIVKVHFDMVEKVKFQNSVCSEVTTSDPINETYRKIIQFLWKNI